MKINAPWTTDRPLKPFIERFMKGAPGQWIKSLAHWIKIGPSPSLPWGLCSLVFGSQNVRVTCQSWGQSDLATFFLRWCIIITIQNESVMMNSRIWGILINCRALKALGSRSKIWTLKAIHFFNSQLFPDPQVAAAAAAGKECLLEIPRWWPLQVLHPLELNCWSIRKLYIYMCL